MILCQVISYDDGEIRLHLLSQCCSVDTRCNGHHFGFYSWEQINLSQPDVLTTNPNVEQNINIVQTEISRQGMNKEEGCSWQQDFN